PCGGAGRPKALRASRANRAVSITAAMRASSSDCVRAMASPHAPAWPGRTENAKAAAPSIQSWLVGLACGPPAKGAPAPFRLRCCGLDRSDQRPCREGLAQADDATGLHGLLMRAFIVEGGHEDDRHRRTGFHELPAQLDTGHAAEVNVEHQTNRFA